MIEIKNSYTNKVIYSFEAETIKEAVEKAIKERDDIIPEIYYLRMVEIINNIK